MRYIYFQYSSLKLAVLQLTFLIDWDNVFHSILSQAALN